MTDETPTGDPTSPGSEPRTPAAGAGDAPGADLPTIPPIVPQTPTPESSEPITAESVAADPTAPEPTVPAGAPMGGPAPNPATAPGAPNPAWTPAPSGASRRVGVPLWLLLGLGGLLLVALGFLGGWAVGSNDSSSTSANDVGDVRLSPRVPNGNGNGNGGRSNGGGGGFTLPPGLQNGNRVVLGVITQPSSGKGARIVAVVPTSPADDGGLKRGDVITKVGDDAVKNPQQLATRIRAHKSGEQVTITYTRDGDTKTASVRLVKGTSIVPRIPSDSNSGSTPQF